MRSRALRLSGPPTGRLRDRLGPGHLLRLVRDHAAHYNADRPHMSLNRDAPFTRAVEPPSAGHIIALPRIGGLHHRYVRAA